MGIRSCQLKIGLIRNKNVIAPYDFDQSQLVLCPVVKAASVNAQIIILGE